MRTFSSADAKNHFGVLVDAARLAAVAVTKYGKPFVVVMSAEEYERVIAAAGPGGSGRKNRIGGKNEK
jgi:prevent-host-death family protein